MWPDQAKGDDQILQILQINTPGTVSGEYFEMILGEMGLGHA